jgi:hypothetical protein
MDQTRKETSEALIKALDKSASELRAALERQPTST